MSVMPEARLVLIEERVKRQLQKVELMTPAKRQRVEDTRDLCLEVRRTWNIIRQLQRESRASAFELEPDEPVGAPLAIDYRQRATENARKTEAAIAVIIANTKGEQK